MAAVEEGEICRQSNVGPDQEFVEEAKQVTSGLNATAQVRCRQPNLARGGASAATCRRVRAIRRNGFVLEILEELAELLHLIEVVPRVRRPQAYCAAAQFPPLSVDVFLARAGITTPAPPVELLAHAGPLAPGDAHFPHEQSRCVRRAVR